MSLPHSIQSAIDKLERAPAFDVPLKWCFDAFVLWRVEMGVPAAVKTSTITSKYLAGRMGWDSVEVVRETMPPMLRSGTTGLTSIAKAEVVVPSYLLLLP